MDAIDVAWCLGCNRHLDSAAAYCSKQCHNDHAALPTRHHTPPPLPPSASQFFCYSPSALSADDNDDRDVLLARDDIREPLHASTKAVWIGRGDAGILAWACAIPAGPPEVSEELVKPASPQRHTFRQPELILSQKRPVPPTLCMSKTLPAPPEPSRPILTPQQSLPSMSSQYSATEASLTSLTTALSSLSIATPASSSSDAAAEADLPSAETQKPLTLMGNLTAHLRSWATPSQHGGNGKAHVRSPTVTRRVLDAPSEASQYPPRSPVSLFLIEHFALPTEKPRLAEKELGDEVVSSALSNLYLQRQRQRLDDHPAFRVRGRKASRAVS